MDWMESQLDVRRREDAEMTEKAYNTLAASVEPQFGRRGFVADDADSKDVALHKCLRYLNVEPGNVPDAVSSIEDRIDWMCRPSGTMHRAVNLTGKWYRDSFGALLGTMDTGETVALLPRLLGGYNLYDPDTGRKVRVSAKVAEHLEEKAIYFYRPLPQGTLTIRDLMTFILRTFDRSDYFLILLAALVSAVVGLLPARVYQVTFGTVVPSGQHALIVPLAALLLGVSISSALITICRNLVMARVSTKLQVATEAATFARVLMLPPSFFREYASGNLASRVSQVTMLINQLTSLFLGSGLTMLLSLIYIAQIALYAPSLVLPAFVVILAEAVLTVVAAIVSARNQRTIMQSNAKLSGTVTALLNGVRKIKLAGAEDRAFARWASGYADYARAMYNRPFIERSLPALITFVSMLGNVVIYYSAGMMRVSPANFIAFSEAYGQVSAAIAVLASMTGQVAQIRPMLEMVAPILEAIPETGDDKPSISRINGGIEVSNVSFRYDESAPYVLQDLSFKIRPGEYVALVGRSGCGKSTVLRLLLGFETAERGSIFYGPNDIRKVDLRSLRQCIGTVMQDGQLFMGDLASNITIAAPTATLDDAWKAAEVAGIADDIRKMPMGMQTIVSEGAGGFSGGQRQRIMIARAVCGNRRILMFDEATSALDNVTQKHVSDSLEKLKCTRLVVAHRLSTVRHCDRIMVLDGGKIAEEGTYEELIERDGIFAELVARQRLD